MSKRDMTKLLIEIRDAAYFLKETDEMVEAFDLDNLTADELNNARGELANASNAIDDAMGEIDKLLAPVPTRSEWEGD